MMKNKDWFVSWFDTEYYHTLYKHRDDTEAHDFVKNLVSFLKLTQNDTILDLACGKGRHAIYLNQLGFNGGQTPAVSCLIEGQSMLSLRGLIPDVF